MTVFNNEPCRAPFGDVMPKLLTPQLLYLFISVAIFATGCSTPAPKSTHRNLSIKELNAKAEEILAKYKATGALEAEVNSLRDILKCAIAMAGNPATALTGGSTPPLPIPFTDITDASTVKPEPKSMTREEKELSLMLKAFFKLCENSKEAKLRPRLCVRKTLNCSIRVIFPLALPLLFLAERVVAHVLCHQATFQIVL